MDTKTRRDFESVGPNFFSTYSDLAPVCEAGAIAPEVWETLPRATLPAVQLAQHKEPLFNFVFDANKHLTTAIGARTVPTEKEAELCT